MKVVSWKGNNINDGTNYTAGMIGNVLGLPTVGVRLVERFGRWPVMTGLTRKGRTVVVNVVVRKSDWDAAQAELAGWFDPEDETAGQLIVSDNAGTNQRYWMAICEQLVEDKGSPGNDFLAVLQVVGDVRLRAVTPDSVTWSITATGQTKVVANGGDDNAYPILSIKPTSAKTGGYAWRRRCFVRWRLSEGAIMYPVDVTDGVLDGSALLGDSTRSVQVNNGAGIDDVVTTIPYDTEVGTFPSSGLAYVDTEQISYTGKTGTDLTGVTRGVNGTTAASHADNAVIEASKVQADADDLRLLVDGVAADRWVTGLASAVTHVWANLNFSPKAEALLGTAIASTGTVDTIDVVDSLGKPANISGFPGAGAVMIDSEVFIYTSKNDALGRFLGVTRAGWDTSMAAHSAGVTVWWIQHDLILLYGNQDAAAPVVDDDYKPVIDLSASFNSTWVWEEFGEDDGLRPGAWVVQTQSSGPQDELKFYTDNRYTYADPWAEVGIHLKNIWQSLFGLGRWGFYNPCGITEIVTVAGERFCLVSPSTEFEAAVQSSGNGFSWVTAYTIAAPTVANTWSSWTTSSVTLASGTKWLGLMLRIPLGSGGAVDTRRVEMDVIGVEFNTSFIPAVTLGTEVGNYSLACRITNNTTGEAIDLDFVMALDEELEVDTDGKTVVYLLDNSSQFQALTVVGGARRDWLPLAPGNNTLQFDDVGTVAVTVTVDYEERFYQ